MRLPDAELGSMLRVQEKTVLCLSAVTDEDGHPLENEAGRMLRQYRGSNLQARIEGPKHLCTRIFCGLFRKFLTISVGPLIGPSLTISLP